MKASDLLKAGKLQEAIDAQIQTVKSKPADQGERVFLFELLCFAGDLDRAQRQLDAVKYNEAERDAGVQSYRKLLDAERARRRWFAEGVRPKFLAEPPEHMKLRLDAVDCLRGKQAAQASELIARADAAAPGLKGELNSKLFDVLRDADDFFGPVIEVLAHGDYYWAPLDQIDRIAMKAPQSLRDLLWIPARLEIRNGPAGDVFLPALYPGSHEHSDEQIKLGRATEWGSPDAGPVRGAGSRTYLCGDDAVSLLEWRQLQMA